MFSYTKQRSSVINPSLLLNHFWNVGVNVILNEEQRRKVFLLSYLFTVIILFFTFWASSPNFFFVYIFWIRRWVQLTKDDHYFQTNIISERDIRRRVFFDLSILTDGRFLMISLGEISSTVTHTQYHPSQHPPRSISLLAVTFWWYIKIRYRIYKYFYYCIAV